MVTVLVGADGNLGRCLCIRLKSLKVTVVPVVREYNPASSIEARSWKTFINDPNSLPMKSDKLILSFGNLDTSLEDSLNIIERSITRMASFGCEQVVYLSSLKVLENSNHNEVISDASNVESNVGYGRVKYLSELKVAELCEQHGMSYSILRLPLILGGATLNPNLSSLISVCRRLPPIGDWGSLLFRRSILAIEDFCSLVEQCVADPVSYQGSWVISNGDIPLDLQLLSTVARGRQLAVDTKCGSAFRNSDYWARLIFRAYPPSKPLETSTELKIFDRSWSPERSTYDILSGLLGRANPNM